MQGKEIFGSAPDGSDIYKDKKGYYTVQWDSIKMCEYKKYLNKEWEPDTARKRIVLECKLNKCVWKIIT